MNPTTSYDDMKAFLRFFAERYLDSRAPSPGERPLAVLERLEQESPERAASGLRMAVNNCMEISAPWPLVQILSLDAEMFAKGILTLSQVRSGNWGRYTAMLKRGEIRNDDEWVVAQGVLTDPSLSQRLPENERKGLVAMVSAYAGGGAKPPVEKFRPGASGRISRSGR